MSGRSRPGLFPRHPEKHPLSQFRDLAAAQAYAGARSGDLQTDVCQALCQGRQVGALS
jgi:hypothetical protein